MTSARYALYTKRTIEKLYVSKLFHRQTIICHITLTLMLTGGNWSVVQGVCQLDALQEEHQLLLPSRTLSTANAKLSGKLAAVMHIAAIRQDSLARHTVIVLVKPCASILSPNMMRVKLDMIMRMKVIIRRKRGARENGE